MVWIVYVTKFVEFSYIRRGERLFEYFFTIHIFALIHSPCLFYHFKLISYVLTLSSLPCDSFGVH